MTYTNATTLVEFLRARLDEVERLAGVAIETYGGADQWRLRRDTDPDYGTEWRLDVGDRSILAGYPSDEDEYPFRRSELAHIAEHDPARVLADVEAKRRIVEECKHIIDTHFSDDFTADTLAEDCLKLLALPYAEHPDYDPSWRPAEVTA